MILLDTNIIIWVLRAKPEVVRMVDKLSHTDKTALSVITIAEVYQNVLPHELDRTEEYFDSNEILDVNRHIAKAAGLYWNQYQKKFQTLGTTDCLIAATAKYYNCPIVTLNTRHFPMPDIKVLNPLKLIT